MITAVPPKKFHRREGKPRPLFPTPTPTPTALTLVAAVYPDSTFVQLTFDRAIDLAPLAAGAVVVDDEEITGTRYHGAGPGTLLTPQTVQIGLTPAGPATGTGVRLTAGPGSGIVADDDGGTWAGVTDLSLPFP